MRGRDHTNEVFKRLNLLKFQDIKIYCCATYTYKAINSIIPNKYFSYRNTSQYNLRNPDLLNLPRVGSTQSKSFIDFRGAKVWNSLPSEIRNKSTIQSFKYALRSHLVSQYAPLS